MNLYPPQHHQESEYANVIETLKTFPLALLITIENSDPSLTHLPLLYEKNAGLGKLIGHIDNNNPQLKHLKEDAKVTLVFNGPDSYISPSIYTTTQLPTWNYIKIHLEGKVTKLLNHEELKTAMVNLTQFLEGKSQNYTLEKDNSRMEAFVNYVTGFEIEIIAWEGKFKLSQDKKYKDQQQAKTALANNYADVMMNYLETIYLNHSTKKG